MTRSDRLGRVVVIGSGFAGMLAARVLADHAAQVTIVERDRLPAQPQHRAGVPQDRHIHVVLAGGQRALEALLPGVVDDLSAAGVPAVAHPRDVVQLNRGLWVRRWQRSIPFLTGTRPLVEQVVRQRVLAGSDRIELVEASEVVGLHGDRHRVRGVLVRGRGAGEPGPPEVLAADLVVDASGRGSRTPSWLQALGAPAPVEERIETGLAYATRLYRRPPAPDGDYRGIYLVPHPGMPRSAVVMPIELPDHYLVTLSGVAGQEPPTDPAGFEAFADSLESPLVAQWLASAEAVGPPMGHRGTANVRRRWDRLRGPEGLLVVGDAATAFNPLYGQGISVAALGAVALGRVLAAGHRSVRPMQRAIVKAAAPAWDISSGVDRSMPGATGNAARSSRVEQLVSWYLVRVQERAASSWSVAAAFRDVVHLLAPASSLFTPRMLGSVLLGRSPSPLAEPPLFAEPG